MLELASGTTLLIYLAAAAQKEKKRPLNRINDFRSRLTLSYESSNAQSTSVQRSFRARADRQTDDYFEIIKFKLGHEQCYLGLQATSGPGCANPQTADL